jgi:hypothetical protein
LTADVAGASARAEGGSIAPAVSAAAPVSRPRRVGMRRLPGNFREDIRRLDSAVLLPIGARENALLESKLGLNYCSAAYVD